MSFRTALLVVFAVSFLLSGIAFWTIPYSQASLLEFSFFWKWLVITGVVSAVAAWRTKLTFSECSAASALGPGAAALARILVEISANPASHPLWAFELVIALCVGGIGGLVGASLVAFRRKLRRTEGPDSTTIGQ